jgi:hypothetical protein
MLGPLADINKLPVIFLDTLGAFRDGSEGRLRNPSPVIADLQRAFDALFVLTSNVVAGHSRDEISQLLVGGGFQSVSQNLHEQWATPCVSTLANEVEAWHATAIDRTPTSYLIVTTKERSIALGHLADYTLVHNGPFLMVSPEVVYEK